MKRFAFITFAALFLICAALPAFADMGLGIMVGEPSGITFRLNNFPVLGAAWSFREYIHFHADFWILNDVIYEPVRYFVGIGAKCRIYYTDQRITENQGTSFAIGVRVPLGLQYYPIPQLELFLEIAPGIMLFPSTTMDMDAGLGIRYIFGT